MLWEPFPDLKLKPGSARYLQLTLSRVCKPSAKWEQPPDGCSVSQTQLPSRITGGLLTALRGG